MVARRNTSRSILDAGERPEARYLDEDEMVVDDPVPVNDFSELDQDEDAAPSDRRRDPLRRRF